MLDELPVIVAEMHQAAELAQQEAEAAAAEAAALRADAEAAQQNGDGGGTDEGEQEGASTR